MKWSRAVHHLEALAASCADMLERPVSIVPLRVTALHTYGDGLGPPRELEEVPVALSVDLPPEDVPWLGEPRGAGQWSYATRLGKNPFSVRWRSAQAPVWNHEIVRPVLLWDASDGLRSDALEALRAGDAGRFRDPAPSTDALRERLATELDLSLRTLRAASTRYGDRRWAPGKLEPVADDLWVASEGYLDLLDAVRRT